MLPPLAVMAGCFEAHPWRRGVGRGAAARPAAALATVQLFATDVMKPSIFGKRVRKLKATSRVLSSANLDTSA